MHRVHDSLKNIFLEPSDAKRLAIFAGELNGNIKLIEKSFNVKIYHNGNKLNIKGTDENSDKAANALLDLYKQTQENNESVLDWEMLVDTARKLISKYEK